jgi:Tol biopolymer transport system component
MRHWDTWADGRRSHLFVVAVAGGEPVDVMNAMDADAPSKPFGGNDEYAFTPDGAGIVFAARDVAREEAWSTNFDLFLAPVDGSSPPKNLTKANLAWDTSPAFSPDGKTLAYLAMKRPGYESDRFRIVLAPGRRQGRVLTEGWDARRPRPSGRPTERAVLHGGRSGPTRSLRRPCATGRPGRCGARVMRRRRSSPGTHRLPF